MEKEFHGENVLILAKLVSAPYFTHKNKSVDVQKEYVASLQ
jgi:hypothetical protein